MADHHDALWAKLHELELRLAAQKLLRAAAARGMGENDAREQGGAGAAWAAGCTCRGRQYDAYMRRRDARRVAVSSEQQPAKSRQAQGTRAAGSVRPMSPRALRCTAREDTREVKRMPAVSIPITPRREGAALPRSRTVNGGAGAMGSPVRSAHHQRRSSLGVPAEFGDGGATPRPFLRRGTGTGGAVALAPGTARLRTPRVHNLPLIDVPATASSTPRQTQQKELARGAQAARHVRSVSELPFDAAALASPQAHARARKRWDSPERSPAAMFAAADSHSMDFSKGLKKLLSFVRKGSNKQAAAADQPCLAPSPGESGKPVRKGWSGRVAACSALDVPFDRASLEGHRFPMTRAVGISG